MNHPRLCQITLTTRKECQRPAMEDFSGFTICEVHALMTVAYMKERGGATMRRLDSVYEEPPVLTHTGPQPPVYVQGKPSVVYYMKFGQEVKIGHSFDLRRRVRELQPEVVLAVEPGLQGDENRRHLRFYQQRTHGEFFQLDHGLISHIKAIQAIYGDPFEAVDAWTAQALAA